ncbi:sensor histidine kinase [[Actinomadura] parvosata]|uniref:sensor histidine kinase n=1 Tax=[Actinomadura] parvosata TaxID=1955412 RepID=UPI00406CAA88
MIRNRTPERATAATSPCTVPRASAAHHHHSPAATCGHDHVIDRIKRLTADASHELRTPLAALRAQVEDARSNIDQIDLPDLLDHVLRDIDRLQAVICDLLLLAGARSHLPEEREPVDLTELARAAASARGESVVLRLRHHVRIMAVRTHIVRVLEDLLDNAQRHAEHAVHLQIRSNGRMVEVSVEDDGPGIAPADRERVFEPFFRLDAARDRHSGGSGLGLAIARDIALAHGGTLTVEDCGLGGARFVLRLPSGPG